MATKDDISLACYVFNVNFYDLNKGCSEQEIDKEYAARIFEAEKKFPLLLIKQKKYTLKLRKGFSF
jgi:hypothetical protein